MKHNTMAFLSALYDLLRAGFTVSGALFAISSTAPGSNLSKTAELILQWMKRGFGFSEAIIGAGLLPDRKMHSLIKGTAATGNPLIAVQLLLTNAREESDFKRNMLMSLAYPAFIIVSSTALAVFVGIYALPFAEQAGTGFGSVKSGNIMYDIVSTISGSLISSAVLAVCIGHTIANQTFRTRYWQLVHTLVNADIQIDACLLQCEKALHIPPDKTDQRLRLDSFSSSILSAMMHSGEVKTAIASIAAHYRSKLSITLEVIERISAPAAILIAGITLCRLAITIFMPILGMAGGF